MSLQGCSEQRATEVLRRTGPLVRLRLLRSALRLSPNLPPVPPLHPLRHSHSFSESSSHHNMGLKRIHKTGALRQEHVCPFDIWFWTIKKGIIWKAWFELNYVMLLFESLNWFFFFFLSTQMCFPMLSQGSAHCVNSPGMRRTPADGWDMFLKMVCSFSMSLIRECGQKALNAVRQRNNKALACQSKLPYDVCVCLFLYLIHSEYQNLHCTTKVRTLLGSEDNWGHGVGWLGAR